MPIFRSSTTPARRNVEMKKAATSILEPSEGGKRLESSRRALGPLRTRRQNSAADREKAMPPRMEGVPSSKGEYLPSPCRSGGHLFGRGPRGRLPAQSKRLLGRLHAQESACLA